jgi:hypothetical protein
VSKILKHWALGWLGVSLMMRLLFFKSEVRKRQLRETVGEGRIYFVNGCGGEPPMLDQEEKWL